MGGAARVFPHQRTTPNAYTSLSRDALPPARISGAWAAQEGAQRGAGRRRGGATTGPAATELGSRLTNACPPTHVPGQEGVLSGLPLAMMLRLAVHAAPGQAGLTSQRGLVAAMDDITTLSSISLERLKSGGLVGGGREGAGVGCCGCWAWCSGGTGASASAGPAGPGRADERAGGDAWTALAGRT